MQKTISVKTRAKASFDAHVGILEGNLMLVNPTDSEHGVLPFNTPLPFAMGSNQQEKRYINIF